MNFNVTIYRSNNNKQFSINTNFNQFMPQFIIIVLNAVERFFIVNKTTKYKRFLSF